MIKAIIFDYFGVIRRSAIPMTYEQLGGNYEHDRQFVEDTLHAAHRGLIENSRQLIADQLGVSVDEYTNTLNANMGGNDQHLLKFIESLKSDYKIGLLSNISKGSVSGIFEPDEARLFDAIVLSGNFGYAKPEPEAYRLIAGQLGCQPEQCVFTDDNIDYCAGARATGMQTIHYKSLAQFKRELAALA